MIRAGDQVWHHDTQRELAVAAVDSETNELATDAGEWVPVAACTRQIEASFGDHKRALIRWSRTGGRVGVVARRTLADLWSDGRWSR